MKTAKYLKSHKDWTGDARVYELSEPVEYDDGKTSKFVVVSATVVPFSGPETYIFPCDEDGKVLDWSELDGSFKGGMDHGEALGEAGYSIAPTDC